VLAILRQWGRKHFGSFRATIKGDGPAHP